MDNQDIISEKLSNASNLTYVHVYRSANFRYVLSMLSAAQRTITYSFNGVACYGLL